MTAKRLFTNRNFILILAMVLGLTASHGAVLIQPILLPVLAAGMTLTTISVSNRDLTSIKNTPRTILISLLLNYVVMSGIMLLLAKWMINDSQLWAGFVTIAAMPPATSIVPFSYMLGGNTVFSLIGVAGSYLVALGLTPSIMILLLGTDLINPVRLLLTLGYLIVIPIVVSRILLFKGLYNSIVGWRDKVLSWCYFVTIYIIIGLNQQVLFEQPSVVSRVIIISIAVTFALGHAIYFIARKIHTDRANSIAFTMMGTRKNTGLASVLTLTFIGQRASLPAAICTILQISYFVWLGYYFRKQAE